MKQSTEYMMSEESGPSTMRVPKVQLTYINRIELERAKAKKSLCAAKLTINKQIWENQQGDLQSVFLQYPFCQQVGFTATDLINLKNVKLIKAEHRIYFGQVAKTKKQGRGISVYSDGKLYEGYHLNNQKNGIGCELYNNGNLYIGDFDRNKKHGKGTFYWLNLESNNIIEYYIGEWWDGLPSGVGKHQRCNGDLYQGEFRNGLKHGQGIEHFNNGDVYKGQYINGLPEGYGQYTWSNQSNYKGEFKQGLRFGFGCWKKDQTQNCQSYRGHYVMDLKSGHGIYTWTDGKFYKGQFLNDKKHGFGQLYQNQTLKYKGIWEDGKPSQNTSQIGQNTMNRIRSNSGSLQSFQNTKEKLTNQSKSTHRVINFRTRAQSRQPTFEGGHIGRSTINTMNEIKLKRPSTGAPVNLGNLSKNTLYRVKGGSKQLDSRSESHNNRHKHCIPIYPWERHKSAVKH